MKAHIFTDSGVLKVITEEVPKKPNQHSNGETDLVELTLWKDAITALKSRATVVGNTEEAKQLWEVQNNGVPMNGQLYPIDCEVRIVEEKCTADDCWHINRNVAYLSPKKEEPTRTNVAELSLIAQKWCDGNFGGERENIWNAGYEGYVHGYLAATPSKKEEPAESQDELWKDVGYITSAPYFDSKILELKSKYTLTRKNHPK